MRNFEAPIRTTAKEFCVQEAFLRHKLSGRVDAEATRSGPPTMLADYLTLRKHAYSNI